jgi:hypothetical protein
VVVVVVEPSPPPPPGAGAAAEQFWTKSPALEQPHTLKLSLLPDSMQNTPSAEAGQLDPVPHSVYPQQLLLLGFAFGAQPAR